MDTAVSEGNPLNEMSEYEQQVWNSLNSHWQRRNNRRGLPNWAGTAIERTGDAATTTFDRLAGAIPEGVREPMRRGADVALDTALRPALAAAAGLLDLVNDWVVSLNDPKNVEALAKRRGIEISDFSELRHLDLRTCDRLLTRHTLWSRTAGALEGGAMGALAMVPVAGTVTAITADVVVVHVLSVSIASRIAYSYGYDAKDPGESEFIESLVHRSFMAQAAKARPMRDTARAWSAARNRVNWSPKLRSDHRLLAALEKLMQQAGPAGSKVSISSVTKIVPYVGVLLGAGVNATVLGGVAADAQRYCQTRFLCEKYGLPLPAALTGDPAEPEL